MNQTIKLGLQSYVLQDIFPEKNGFRGKPFPQYSTVLNNTVLNLQPQLALKSRTFSEAVFMQDIT